MASTRRSAAHQQFDGANKLRRHLKGAKYKERKLTILEEKVGRPVKERRTNVACDKLNTNPSSTSTTRSCHEEQIEYMEKAGFDMNVVDTFRKLNLSTIEDISPETEQLWKEYNNRLPSTINAKRCWNIDRPSDTELFTATIDFLWKSSRTCSVIQKGEPTDQRTAIEVIAQLTYPNAFNPLKLVDLRLPMLKQECLAVPNDLVCSYASDNLQILVTPKYSVSQLHFDNADGLSGIIGESGRKFFATFPNSTRNRKLFRKTLGKEAKLEEIGHDLEGGLIYILTSDNVIDLPAHCFHAVVTLEGCFLATIDFITPRSTKAYTQLISSELDMFIGTTRQRDLFDWFLTAFEVAWKHEHVHEALSSWIKLSERTKQWGQEKENGRWLKEAIEFFIVFCFTKSALSLWNQQQGIIPATLSRLSYVNRFSQATAYH
ncbi:domain-containing histone demethylation 1 protein [Rutstroemia sp. NJR-2017a BBW]|nr:domain-containing histone demethylation 1 protein [Rutstroemia sp. NJR-2017a BBW]